MESFHSIIPALALKGYKRSKSEFTNPSHACIFLKLSPSKIKMGLFSLSQLLQPLQKHEIEGNDMNVIKSAVFFFFERVAMEQKNTSLTMNNLKCSYFILCEICILGDLGAVSRARRNKATT